MTTHKSPSSVRWLALKEQRDAQRERREILETRRASATSAREGTQHRFGSALPKHPKMGRHYSNPSSSATITGGTMKHKPYDYRKVTQTEPMRPQGKMNWELLLPKNYLD